MRTLAMLPLLCPLPLPRPHQPDRNRVSWIASRSIRIGLLATCLSLLVAAPSALAEPRVDLSAFEGDWRLVDGAAGRANRERVVEHAVESLNWVLRKMAGPRLVSSLAPPAQIGFFRRGNQLRQRVVEAKGALERPVELGGAKARMATGNGEPFEGEWSISASGLQLDWRQHQAYGRNLYRIDPETGSMFVEQTIQITAIDDVAPIVFESRFDRTEPPAVSAHAELDRP